MVNNKISQVIWVNNLIMQQKARLGLFRVNHLPYCVLSLQAEEEAFSESLDMIYTILVILILLRSCQVSWDMVN